MGILFLIFWYIWFNTNFIKAIRFIKNYLLFFLVTGLEKNFKAIKG
jgi:hypothetical protein